MTCSYSAHLSGRIKHVTTALLLSLVHTRGQCSSLRMYWGRLDLAVLFTPSTPNRQNRNQVHWNNCAGVRRSTPSSEVVLTEQSHDLFQKRWRITACMRGYILYRLIYSGVLQVSSFTCLGRCSGVRGVL